jgi:hypothetical protein
MAIHLLLMHGVRITASTSSSDTSHHLTPDETRIIRAQIDTKLFQCLRRLMKNIHHELQRLIFRTSGQLPHDAIFPVSLTMWLLVLIQYSRAGYMENLRPKTSSSKKRYPLHRSLYLSLSSPTNNALTPPPRTHTIHLPHLHIQNLLLAPNPQLQPPFVHIQRFIPNFYPFVPRFQ